MHDLDDRNLDARVVSGSRVTRPLAALLLFALGLGPVLASAQDASPESGYELALSGPTTVRGDREARLRGVAYRVRGLATLVPYAGAVRARFHRGDELGAWQSVTSDREGRFELGVPIGHVESEGGGDPQLDVEVGPEEAARAFEVPLELASPVDLSVFSDRNLYEPGEPVHVWALVRDRASGRPLAGREVRFALQGAPLGSRSEVVTTTLAGVAHLTFTLAEEAPDGSVGATVAVDGARHDGSFRVGTRTWERLFAHVRLEPREVAPGAAATAIVTVTSADATPIRGATVDVTVDEGVSVRGSTSSDGEARVEVHAPTYLMSDTGYAGVRVHVAHPAYGSVDAFQSMRLAVPSSLSLELIPAHGALVPEVDDVLFVRLEDALHEPPPVGTSVDLTGAAVPGGRAHATTDANGLAAFAVRLPRGASSGDDDDHHTTLRAHVSGSVLELTSRQTVAVDLEPEVVPTLAHPLAEPGATLDVRLARRASAQRATLVVELRSLDGDELIDLVFAAPTASAVQLRVPPDRLGRFYVRARAVHANESLEGVGASDTLLVRPPAPDFVSLTPVRERWQVGETAQVQLHTRAGGPRAWGALLVRDLAAHGGESDFALHFLRRAFEEALLEPTGEVGERLLRAALAASAPRDVGAPTASPIVDALGLPDVTRGGDATSAERGVLRDPWPIARELERRGVGAAMAELETALTDALDAGSLDQITEGRGRARRFRADLLLESETRTLGDTPLTPAMLEAADPSFSYENVARRVARLRLIRVLSALARYLDPGDEASIAARTAAREPSARWLPRMVERGVLPDEALDDPWGGRFALHPSTRPSFVLSTHATTLELSSPGPDGRLGTTDDVRDPFARAVPTGTAYAVSSGEDALMRLLAVLSPAARTLEALAEAYGRISAEMSEDEIGDAVHASVSGGTIGLGSLGTIGHGSGGGGGSGYGSGGGGLRGRAARSPTIRGGGVSLARVVRERFPPTILFTPAFDVDASGTTTLAVPLADAVTSYRIEVIVWREDGWLWSARTEIASDREIVIDAPIPTVARLGDRLEIPVRVQNHGPVDRELLVSLEGDAAIGVDGLSPQRVLVPAGGASAVVATLSPRARGTGSLRVVATDAAGAPLDAVRRPLTVVRPFRRVRRTVERLLDGRGEITFRVDEDADPIAGIAHVAVGGGLFDPLGESRFSAWVGGGGESLAEEALPRIEVGLSSGDADVVAFSIGAAYTRDTWTGERLRTAEERLARLLAADVDLATSAWALLGLAPAARALDARAELSADTESLIARLAAQVAERASGIEDDAALSALTAAALGWSGDPHARPRVTELVRRARSQVIEVGDDVWLADAERPVRATLLLAMAELALDDRATAFALLATVARHRALGHTLSEDESGLAHAVAARLGAGVAPANVELRLDGTTMPATLEGGRAELLLGGLATTGVHSVALGADGTSPALVTLHATFGVPWDRAPARAGPFGLAFAGSPGRRDEVSELELVIVNRSPRWIPAPVVELDLPTGAELAEDQHDRIRALVRSTERGDGTLTLTLHALAPGREVRIPLPVRWSIAGTLAGIGASAYAADAPDAISILAPTALEIGGDAP